MRFSQPADFEMTSRPPAQRIGHGRSDPEPPESISWKTPQCLVRRQLGWSCYDAAMPSVHDIVKRFSLRFLFTVTFAVCLLLSVSLTTLPEIALWVVILIGSCGWIGFLRHRSVRGVEGGIAFGVVIGGVFAGAMFFADMLVVWFQSAF